MFKKDGRGILVAVGGGESGDITEDSIKIIEKFIEYAGGMEKAKIVLMTVATDKPENAGERYEQLFGRLKFKNFEIIDIAERNQSYDEGILKKVGDSTGLYFTGGSQLHVTALIGGTPLHQMILDRYNKGLVIGGTSAGAMMMSSSTLVSGESDCAPRLGGVEVAPGMELIDNSIIDTHFSQRGRHGRLLSAVVHNPQSIGIGIDERTAMIVQGDKFEVLGEGAVTVVCAKNSMHTNLPYIKNDETIGAFGVDFHVLPAGYQYDLQKREPIAPSVKKMLERK